MLQPLQLQDVSIRYAPEIAELRDFLAKAGLELGTAHSLGQVVGRLRDDRAFRRDLTSHAWVVLHSGDQPIRYADLLGMLSVAAAGVGFATEASEADAQALLRFLMEAKGSFDTDGEVRRTTSARASAVVVVSSRPMVAEAESGLRRFRREAVPVEERPLSLEMPEEAFDQRKFVWAGVGACLLVALCVGLWVHHRAGTDRTSIPSTATAGSAPVTTPAGVSRNGEDQVPASASRASSKRGSSNSGSSSRVLGKVSSGSAPYSTLSETSPDALESRSGVRSKPSPGTPMAPVTTAAPRNGSPTLGGFKVPRNVRPSSASSPAAVAEGDSRRAVVLGSLNTPVGPSRGGADAVHQATVRPTSLGIMAANVMYSPAPAYPVAASAARIQGEVKLEAEVDRDGNVASTRVISGPPLLSDAAVDAVQRWRYRPYLYEGKPIAMNAMVVVDFQLP